MENYYVYILKCADSSYYTGITNDLNRRFAEHESGVDPDCYTFSRRPLEIVFYQVYNDVLIAISWEKRIKKWSRKKKEALISENWDALKEFSKCKNETSHLNYKKVI